MNNDKITKEHFTKQLEINPNANKFFVLVKTDAYLDYFKLTELPESLFNDYKYITTRGVFPVVEQKTEIYES